MNIHLIPTEDNDEELYTSVVELLNNVPGPLKIIFDERAILFSDDEKTQEKYDKSKLNTKIRYVENKMMVSEDRAYFTTVKWESIFGKCELYRKRKNLSDNEWVILLTPR